MITETILDAIKSLYLGVFNLLPSLDIIALPEGFFEWFNGILSMGAYFLPVADFLVMFGISLVVLNFEIVWKTITRIWDALPFT